MDTKSIQCHKKEGFRKKGVTSFESSLLKSCVCPTLSQNARQTVTSDDDLSNPVIKCFYKKASELVLRCKKLDTKVVEQTKKALFLLKRPLLNRLRLNRVQKSKKELP